MIGGIEVPVGGIIKAYGSELVCVEDYKDKYGEHIGCRACPIKDTVACVYLCCGGCMRTDFKSVHFEYYYGEEK